MKRLISLFFMLTLLLAVQACADLGDEEVDASEVATEEVATEEVAAEEAATEEAVSTEVPVEVIEGAVCVDVTGPIIESVNAVSESDGGSETVLEETPLVTYVVSGDEISDPALETVPSELEDQQLDEATQQQVWEYYAALIPAENRNTIVEYSVFTDGVDNTLAMVTQTKTDPAAWSLQVDIADTANYYSLTYTLVHEYGHLLTLGPDQVTPSEAVFNDPENVDVLNEEVAACPDYFPGEGCSNPDSYINAFYNQFWTEIYEENQEISYEQDPDLNQQMLTEFYDKYQDQFVTEYAATNPEEDITESWAFFVLGDKPTGDSIADQKVLFFYNYPELVELRSAILGNLCTAFPQ